MNPPSPEGGSYTPPKVNLERKLPPKVIVKEPRQPRKPRPAPEPTEPGPSEPGDGLGLGKGPGTGPGDGPPAADPCKKAGAACGLPPATTPQEVPRPPRVKVHTVPPQILKGLRTSGETAIHPPYAVLQQMHRNEDRKTIASIKVCLATDGTVSSVALLRSTKYAAYDEAIMGAARRWRYKPYTVNGAPVPACGMVTFVYRLN
jgi:protein TonB